MSRTPESSNDASNKLSMSIMDGINLLAVKSLAGNPTTLCDPPDQSAEAFLSSGGGERCEPVNVFERLNNDIIHSGINPACPSHLG